MKAAGDASLAQLGEASNGAFFSAVKLDFTAGCIKGFIEASGASKCDEVSDPPMSMDGFVSFACAEVEGSGQAGIPFR